MHDTARPFASAELLAAVTRAAAASGAAVPGVLVPDTIVQCFGCPDPTSGPALSADVSDTAQARAARYLDRASLLAVQTPQVFRWDRFHAAHLWAAEQGAHFTDDGGLLAVCGLDPVVVPGEADNWKVTTATDWERARALLD